MRHCKRTFKLGRTSSHLRCMLANMLKSLIEEERIVTTKAKAKELQRQADQMITLAKQNTLASRRLAIARLMVRYEAQSSKEARATRGDKEKQQTTVNRRVISKLFDTLGPRFSQRQGGYTRVVNAGQRIGDNAETCIVEFLSE